MAHFIIHDEIVDLGCVHQPLLSEWLMRNFIMAIAG